MTPLCPSDPAVVWGYSFCCPGCGTGMGIEVGPNARRRFAVVAGNPLDPATITLSPEIRHDGDDGCGWRGQFCNGAFVAR